jgi:N-acetylglucosaminyldiphosphoundecaprenol N-acetyl-beta-D-mannosaminyltransferase
MPSILGIKLYGFDIPTAASAFMADIKNSNLRENKLVSATGVHGIVTAQRSAEFKNILDNFFCNLPDGMPVVWIGKLKGEKKMKRCSGPHFFEHLLKESATKPINHFFCGGKDGVADELKNAVKYKFNNENVVGTFSPPFKGMSNEEMEKLGQIITIANANIVWLGLSSPKQEKFAYRLREFTMVNYIVTVGAAFDFHTNRLKKAPRWMQASGLEWFFRLLMEPRRLYKRYLLIVPLFFYYNIRALIIKH